MNTKQLLVIAFLLGLLACGKKEAPQAYEAVPVERRNLVVSASASGAIEPKALLGGSPENCAKTWSAGACRWACARPEGSETVDLS